MGFRWDEECETYVGVSVRPDPPIELEEDDVVQVESENYVGCDPDPPNELGDDDVAPIEPSDDGVEGQSDPHRSGPSGGVDPSGNTEFPSGDGAGAVPGPSRLFDPDEDSEAGAQGTAEFRQLFELVTSLFPESVTSG